MLLERFGHTLSLALKSVLVHGLRSTLTISGIILGVASVIVMLAVGEAARFEAIQQIRDLGATNVIVRSVKPIEENKQKSRGEEILTYGITESDLERIQTTIPTVTSVTPMREFRKDIRYLDRKLDGRVVAALPSYLGMNGLSLSRGRFLTERDDQSFANVVVLGAETAEILFPVEDPVGKSVSIDNQSYRVVGVTESRAPSAGIGSSLSAQDYNRDVYIPFRTDKVRFGKTIIRSSSSGYQIERLEISQITVGVDSMEHVKKTADIIQGLIDQYHTQKDTAITIPLDLLEKAEQTQRIFTLVLGAIASISLLVGGIGIMNIMLATVTERTREIGIRRALGAKRRDIASQFLVETTVLSGSGGILGVICGVSLCFLVEYLFTFKTIIQLWSPLLALGVSLAVGLIFGTYPARRAANMDPIEALRHE
jgi:putative ABC transport system permease protein